MMKKKGEFNFVWLFAIIAGASILFLAIYGAMGVGNTARYQSDSEIAKSISIITDPMQAGFSEGKHGSITFGEETRINNFCDDDGFGKNDISVKTRSNVGKEWVKSGVEVPVTNKYIFSSNNDSGKKYYVFSKPFYFPYKVADLIFLSSKNYCFYNAPDAVASEIDEMNIPNIVVNSSEDQTCSEDSINVCFGGGSDCDITVYGSCYSGCDSVYDEGTVVKNYNEMAYVGNLMYAAIFSEKGIYDCNVNRLIYRAGEIAQEFSDKADLMNARDCGTDLKSSLIIWNGLLNNTDIENLASLKEPMKVLERKNTGCTIW